MEQENLLTKGINNHFVRKHNSRIIMELLYRNKEMSKSQLANEMQLSIPAISKIITSLEDLNKVERIHSETPTKTSCKGAYRIVNKLKNTFCLNISPIKLQALIVDCNFKQQSELFTCRISPKTPEELIEDIIHFFVACKQGYKKETLQLALSVYGQVDYQSGESIKMPLAPWNTSFDLKYILEQRLGVDTLLDNDLAIMALSEKWVGKNYNNNFGILNIDQVLGAVFFIKNEIYRGANNASGQIGHTIVDPNGELCGCGQRGCLETIASSISITRKFNALYHESTDRNTDEVELEFSFADVVRFFHNNHPLARRVVMDVATKVSYATYNLLTTLNINQFILYGSTFRFGEDWLDEIRKKTMDNPFYELLVSKKDQNTIEFGKLSPEQRLIGCCYLWVEKELNEFS